MNDAAKELFTLELNAEQSAAFKNYANTDDLGQAVRNVLAECLLGFLGADPDIPPGKEG